MESAVAEIGVQRYEACKESGIEWLGEIPSHWEMPRLGTLLNGVSEKNRPDLPLLSITREKGVITRDLDDEEENHNLIPDDLSGYKILKEGQLGMNKMKAWQGSYGVAKATGIVSPAYYVFDIPSTINPAFFHVALRSKIYVSFFAAASDGVRIGQWDLSKSRMKEIPFLLPPLEEQTAIADFLDRKTVQIDQTIAQKERLIELLQERQQILIQRAVTCGLNPNVPMKDSGVEWIGEVPTHWEVTQIKKVAKSLSGGTPPSGEREKYYGGLIPWIRTTDLNDSELCFVPEAITQTALRETACKEIQSEFVCVAMYGGAGTIGKHSLVRFASAVNQAVCALIPSSRLLVNYLFFYVKFCRPYWMIVAKGSRVDPNIGQDDIKNFPIVFPSVDEQEEVVAYLNRLTSKTDQSISKVNKEIQKLREYKSTLISAAVTGKIKVC